MRSYPDLIPSWAPYQAYVITPKASKPKDLDVTTAPQHNCFIMKKKRALFPDLQKASFSN